MFMFSIISEGCKVHTPPPPIRYFFHNFILNCSFWYKKSIVSNKTNARTTNNKFKNIIVFFHIIGKIHWTSAFLDGRTMELCCNRIKFNRFIIHQRRRRLFDCLFIREKRYGGCLHPFSSTSEIADKKSEAPVGKILSLKIVENRNTFSARNLNLWHRTWPNSNQWRFMARFGWAVIN